MSPVEASPRRAASSHGAQAGKRRRRGIALGRAALSSALVIALLTACGNSSSSGSAGGAEVKQEGGGTKVSYAVSTIEATLGQAYYTSVPTYLGYWKDQGLDVDITRFNGSGELVTAVATGKVMIGSGGTLSNMAAHVNGGADTKAFFSDIPGSVYYPMVPVDSPIRTLKDFEGKTVGVLSLSADGPNLLKGVMKQEGVDVDSIDFVPVGAGASVVEALKGGKIDAYQGYDSGYAALEALGVKLRRLETPIDDLGFMSGVIARGDTLKSDRDVLVKFARGIAEAVVFTKANPEAAVRIHWKVFPKTRPSGVPEAEALKAGVVELEKRMENVFPVDDEYGRVSDETVQRLIDVATASKFITKPLAVSDIWTPDLLEDANAFDVEEIQRQARDDEPVS